MLIDRAGIERAIPHAGRMCLLEGVVALDAAHIVCVARSPRDPRCPLARSGRVRAACGVEYAAQAMALHEACSRGSGQSPCKGYLASVRDLRLHVAFLDEDADELQVEAERMLGEGTLAVYRFALRARGRTLIEGRAAVVLDSAPGEPDARSS